jgi:hypothetical protein
MNREQWQQKRGHAGATRVPTAITVGEIAHRVGVTALAANRAKPAAVVGGQIEVEKPAVAVRHRKP